MVDILKGKVSNTKSEMEGKFKEKENRYMATIESMK